MVHRTGVEYGLSVGAGNASLKEAMGLEPSLTVVLKILIMTRTVGKLTQMGSQELLGASPWNLIFIRASNKCMALNYNSFQFIVPIRNIELNQAP